MRTMTSIVFVAAVALGACVGEARIHGRATVESPALVYVSPGVYVIADYDEPVFYSNSVYWRYDDGVWYRSSRYSGGWTVAYNVPVVVRRIDRPATYVHVRADVSTRGHGVRDHGASGRGRGHRH